MQKGVGITVRLYEHEKCADIDRVLLSPPHSQNPIHMGLKLDSLTNECSVHFVKAFWSLMEQDAVKVRQIQ